jgi:hypothetical protein
MSEELAGPGEGAAEPDSANTDQLNGPKLYHPDTEGHLSGLLNRQRFLDREVLVGLGRGMFKKYSDLAPNQGACGPTRHELGRKRTTWSV